MGEHRIYSMAFASIYPAYVKKVEKKGRSKADLAGGKRMESILRTP